MLPIDFFDLVGIEDPQIAPDGGSVVYVQARFNLEDNRIERSLWRVRRGDYPHQFTRGITDRAPRWAADGKRIAFLRTDDEKKTHVFSIPADGGEPSPVAGPFDRVAAPVWSPDGWSLAFTATAQVEGADATVAFDEKSGARHVTELPYKSDPLGLFDGSRLQIHVMGPDGTTQIVAGGRFDAGPPSWSPDGKHLAFVANRDAPEGSFVNDLYVVGVQDRTIVRLTEMNGIFTSPSYSRDGQEIALIGNDTDDFGGSRNPQLWCVPAAGGTARPLTPKREDYLGNAIGSDLRTSDAIAPYWMPGDRGIVVQRSHEGACMLTAYTRDGSKLRDLVAGERSVYAYSGADDGTLAFAATDPVEPGDIYLLSDGTEERLTEANLSWLDVHSPLVPRRIRPRAPDGTVLDAWIVDAIEPAKVPPPMVHAIHGGPHAAYGFAFTFEFQILASLGFTVVFGNPRGSQSYGEAYASAITGRWGELDMGDLLAIRDAALADAEVDRKRVAVMGGSYGGLMTTWLMGHAKGYSCAISERAVNDYVSFAGASDIPNFIERETGSDWSDGGKRLFEISPLRRAARSGAAPGPALGARLSLSDRSRRAALHAAAAPRAQRRIRPLHRRQPRPFARRLTPQQAPALPGDRALAPPLFRGAPPPEAPARLAFRVPRARGAAGPGAAGRRPPFARLACRSAQALAST